MIAFGVGLRPKHYAEFLRTSPAIDWVEAISENFMGVGGRPLAVLEKARNDRPVALHGVLLSIGSPEPLDSLYLTQWKELVDRIEPVIVSDHLCWGRAHGRYVHDLLPVPFTDEALTVAASHVAQVQDVLKRQLVLENVSSYLTFEDSQWTEWEFMGELVKRTDCGLLLDINNVYVSSRNHGFDPEAYLAALPFGSIAQIHLAGHQKTEGLLIDTHDGPVRDNVWAWYARAIRRFGPVPTLIEWDDAVPPLETLVAEAARARTVCASAVLTPERGEASPTRRLTEKPPRHPLEVSTQRLFAAVCDAEPIGLSAEELVAEVAPVSARQRIEVYAQMYWLRMRDVLRDGFPLTREGMGAELFDAVVAAFLKKHQSRHFSLDALGAPFAQFVQSENPGWAETARLERAKAESFLAPDAPVASFSELRSVPAEVWADVGLVRHPSVRVLKDTVVWRHVFEVFQAPISHSEAEALQRLEVMCPLAEALEPFDLGEEGATKAFAALQSWFSEGMISQVVSISTRDDRTQ
jgi:uncharacterized protein (UPF0276 family)